MLKLKYFYGLWIVTIFLFCYYKYFAEVDVKLKTSPFQQNVPKKKKNNNMIMKKVSELNDNLGKLRKTLLMLSDSDSKTLIVDKEPIFYVDERIDSFHDILKEFVCVFQIKLTLMNRNENMMSSSSASKLSTSANVSNDKAFLAENFFIDKYYRFTGSNSLCQLIETNEATKNYGFAYNYTCNNETKLAVKPIPHEPLRFNMRSPTKITKVLPEKYFVFPEHLYVMRIFVNGLISDFGEHFCDRLHVKPYDCLGYRSKRPSKKAQLKLPYYEEVFVISQYWGWSHFHRMIEDLPRLALFIDFLRKNPSVKILTADNSLITQNSLEALGIRKSRIITGWTRAKLAYIPRPTSCGTPFVTELQFLHHYFREYIIDHLVLSERNKLILIKRSRKRHFTQHKKIEHYLEAIALEYGLEYVVYYDNPPPSFNDTMRLFALASVIVAPHGAGLSNMLYSKPDTLVIEGVCQNPHLNLCYQITAYNLGMIYHAIMSSGGCDSYVDVDAGEINRILREYLSYIPLEQLTT